MQLWKLEPTNLTDNNWEASTYKGEVIIRAEDLHGAQHIAARAYGIATKRILGKTVKIIPWDYPGLVSTIQIQATDDYAEDGDLGIVYPAAAMAAAHPGYNQK